MIVRDRFIHQEDEDNDEGIKTIVILAGAIGGNPAASNTEDGPQIGSLAFGHN